MIIVYTLQPLANESIGKDRLIRQSLLKSGKNVAIKPKWGFFGTVFNLILEVSWVTKLFFNKNIFCTFFLFTHRKTKDEYYLKSPHIFLL